MRSSHLILSLIALTACGACYLLGLHAGRQAAPLKEDMQGRLALALHTYHETERTNWPGVQKAVSIQLLAITRNYERRFGVESGTNRFARQFGEAKLLADRIEGQLVSVASVLTNVPHTRDAKVTVHKGE